MLVTEAAAAPFFVLRPVVVTPDVSLLSSGGWTRSPRPGIRASEPQPTRKGGPLLVFKSWLKKNKPAGCEQEETVNPAPFPHNMDDEFKA